jgi:hypothetical protein
MMVAPVSYLGQHGRKTRSHFRPGFPANAPVRLDPVQLVAAGQPQQSSTDELLGKPILARERGKARVK